MIVAAICALLAVVVCIIFFTTKPEVKAGVYRLPGPGYWMKRIIFRILFNLRSTKTRPAVSGLDLKNDKAPPPNAGLIGYGRGHGYEHMEQPQSLSASVFAIDCVYFGAVNKDGCNVVCRVARRNQRSAEVWLFLEVPGVGCWQHTRHPDTDVHFTDGKHFMAGGLALEVLEPMRRWRVNYSGKLRVGLCNDVAEKPQEYVEASFSFTWSAFSQAFNFDTDMASCMLGDSVARERWDRDFFHRLKHNHQSHYEQWGELRGKLRVGDHEEMLYLQCVRDHSFGERDWRTFHRYIIHFIYLETGMCIQVGVVSQPCLMSHVKIGYVSYANGDIVSISDVTLNLWEIAENGPEPPPTWSFSFTADGQTFVVRASRGTTPVWYHHEDRGAKVMEVFTDFEVNSVQGRGISEYFYRNMDGPSMDMPAMVPLVQEPPESELCSHLEDLTLAFSSSACRSPALVGGKGAQLAQLVGLQTQVKFCVPPGFCLTLRSCQLQFQTHKVIMDAVDAVAEAAVGNLATLAAACGHTVEVIATTEICCQVQTAISESLQCCFGSEFERLQFAVRSSASGEDGSEASSAGQMDTALGVVGVSQILAAVRQCWGSAYTHQAVEYRRQHGQPINVLVGVVIQHLVPAHTAGVMFTADPMSGSASSIVINANYGLGESVVSGRADPDTITVCRHPEFLYDLTVLQIGSVTPGQKKLKIVHSVTGGVIEEVTSYDTSQLCLTDDMILKLAALGIELEKCYGLPRDIEFATVGQEVFLLQCRPITTADSETEEDLIHEFDSPMICDYQWLTTANISEMMPGAVTPLTLSTFIPAIESGMQVMNVYMGVRQRATHLPKCLLSICNHNFISMIDLSSVFMTIPFNKKDSLEISLLGGKLPDLTFQHIQKYYGRPSAGFTRKIFNLIKMIKMWSTAGYITAEWETKLPSYTVGPGSNTSRDLYHCISTQLVDYEHVWVWTLINSGRSANVTNILMSIIGGEASEWTSDHYGDITLLLSKCQDVYSAEVPHAMENIAQEIVKVSSQFTNTFLSTPDEDCLKLLRQHPNIETMVNAFLDRHGHRCVREAEFREKSWRSAPEKLISVLKTILRSKSYEKPEQSPMPLDEILGQMTTRLQCHKRLILKKLMPWAWKEVGAREWGKSISIQMCEIFKLAYSRLGTLLHQEGMLPDADLVYFLTHREIGTLLASLSPHLVIKAQRRRQILSKQMEKKFEKISLTRPVPVVNNIQDTTTAALDCLKGMPVSQGRVTGPAQVVHDLQDAWMIQAGDILVVRCTDVGWSPYFPLIAGLITELGGLISHGAVVAREYGIPCVVNVAGATRIIKSGELLELDGRMGTVQRLVVSRTDG
ncbi:hypothetical protein BsWGS_22174 [Bradybaena similaris]